MAKMKLKLPKMTMKMGAGRVTLSKSGISASVGNKWGRVGVYPGRRSRGSQRISESGEGWGEISFFRVCVGILVAFIFLVIISGMVVNKTVKEVNHTIHSK